MKAKEMWNLFCEKNQIEQQCFSEWSYGDNADELAELTKKGIKTATSSAFLFYELEKESLPKPGDYSVVLNTQDDAICIIQTKHVEIVPFFKVSEEHAYKEGEGDRSLAYWREVHRTFFVKELSAIQQSFTEELLVVCEEFTVVYK